MDHTFMIRIYAKIRFTNFLFLLSREVWSHDSHQFIVVVRVMFFAKIGRLWTSVRQALSFIRDMKTCRIPNGNARPAVRESVNFSIVPELLCHSSLLQKLEVKGCIRIWKVEAYNWSSIRGKITKLKKKIKLDL